MISGLFTQRPNDSPFTYAPTTTTSGDTLRSSSSSFDPTFNELAHASSPNRNTSLALTIAADDESVASYQQNSRKRGSLENSDLASTLSSPSQHPLAVASLSGAAEADALDQATLVGIHPCEGNKGNGEKVERLKRPPNAYLLYNREMRPKLLDQNDNLNPALISKLISQSWRDLPQEIKDGYRNEATRLKKQHMEDHPDYKYIRRSRTQLEQAGYKSRPSKKQIKTHDDEHSDKAVKKAKVAKQTSASSLATKDTKQQQRRFPDPRGRKKKKHKNPFGPKHPMSGFLYFASDVRPEIVQKHPSSNVGAISKLLAERWKKMTDQDKLPWEEKAREDKARYAREVMEFKLAQDQNELHKQQAENNDTWQQQQRKWMEQNRDGFQYNSNNTNDHSLSSMGTHKSSISSMSSLATSSTTSTATSASARMIKALDHNKLIDTVDYRHHYQHRDDGISTNRHYNKHQQHQKQFYRPVSRIHSALTSSRPASPTELDSDTIQTVAQMVNPRNITPTSSLAHLGRELHPLSASASLASIIHHHHHESSIGTYQLHVPATPPSPAIDTI
ncbi:hypothetical protein BC941DRAFT_173561 [Chlamydoabsidia padenii]|nr:hypothetical protein BC941DRAFT_173561 [Chlamydoabsidia padenii]